MTVWICSLLVASWSLHRLVLLVPLLLLLLPLSWFFLFLWNGYSARLGDLEWIVMRCPSSLVVSPVSKTATASVRIIEHCVCRNHIPQYVKLDDLWALLDFLDLKLEAQVAFSYGLRLELGAVYVYVHVSIGDEAEKRQNWGHSIWCWTNWENYSWRVIWTVTLHLPRSLSQVCWKLLHLYGWYMILPHWLWLECDCPAHPQSAYQQYVWVCTESCVLSSNVIFGPTSR